MHTITYAGVGDDTSNDVFRLKNGVLLTGFPYLLATANFSGGGKPVLVIHCDVRRQKLFFVRSLDDIHVCTIVWDTSGNISFVLFGKRTGGAQGGCYLRDSGRYWTR